MSRFVGFEPCHQCHTPTDCISRCKCWVLFGSEPAPAPESVLSEAAHLCSPCPDPNFCGALDSCPQNLPPESVLEEAARLVDGDRQTARDIIDSSLCATHIHSQRQQKLEQHDEYARLAVDHLASWLHAEADLLLAIAKGRHAEGSLRYGDRLMYEYTQDELLAEASQELGDAINYLSLYIRRWAEGTLE